MSNTLLINDLKSGNNFTYGELYRSYYPSVLRFIRSNSGNIADAEDTFQEALIVLVQKLEQDDFQLTASLKTYLMAITKNLWFKKLRNRHFELQLEQITEEKFQNEIALAIEQEKSYLDKLKAYMTKISSHCNRLINAMFFDGKSIEEVQSEYGYSTRHNAINQKHKCINQIRKVKEADLSSM